MKPKTKSRIPSVRALDVLFQRYEKEINSKVDQEKNNQLLLSISKTKKETASVTLEYIRSCLKNYNTPYREITEKCNWNRTSIDNGVITMRLEFKDSESSTVTKAASELSKIEKAKADEKKRLEEWYDDALLKIVNRIEVIPFGVN
jgi:hypothetical protein